MCTATFAIDYSVQVVTYLEDNITSLTMQPNGWWKC